MKIKDIKKFNIVWNSIVTLNIVSLRTDIIKSKKGRNANFNNINKLRGKSLHRGKWENKDESEKTTDI
jgi:hypothetical protein